jgi:nicotinamidase/pyrazinamidase
MPDALIIVDVQNDFCPGGSLAVPHGDEVIPVLNQYLAIAESAGIPIFASRDWHPTETRHFAEHGGIWPAHCIQATDGAEFHKDLRLPISTALVTKGDNREDHGYSAFEGTLSGGQSLHSALQAAGVTRVYAGGLATDYCVLQTVLDARKARFEVVYLKDGSRPVEVNPGDGARAEEQMLAAGVVFQTIDQFGPSAKERGSTSSEETTSMAPRSAQLTHIWLLVENMPVALTFYHETLGFQIASNLGQFVELDASQNFLLALFERRAMQESEPGIPVKPPAAEGQYAVLAFEIQSLDQFCEELHARGVQFAGGLTNHPEWGLRTAFLHDPDGNLLCLYGPIPE